MVRAADLHDVPVAIRVPVNAPEVILRYLDIGTSAIMVPHVTTRSDAERAVRAVKYPPEGDAELRPGPGRRAPRAGAGRVRPPRQRGDGRLRALRGRGGHRRRSRRSAGVPGLDGVAVGAYDLAASMGHPGDPWREDVQAVVERVRETCRRHRMPFGTVPRDRADLARQIERGCQLITVATLDWGIQATRDAVAELSALTPRGRVAAPGSRLLAALAVMRYTDCREERDGSLRGDPHDAGGAHATRTSPCRRRRSAASSRRGG